jgi:predicted component of type VI protein secretion system
MPYLIQDFDTLMEIVFELAIGSNTLGRGSKNQIVLEDRTKSVSRQHAEILVSAEQVEVIDLGSRNHTFVNGQQVERQRLDDGDIVQLGSLPLKICAIDSGAVAQGNFERDLHDITGVNPNDEDEAEMQVVKQMPTVMHQTIMQDLLRSDHIVAGIGV